MDIDKSKKAITFAEVKHRLENKKLEDYLKQDVFERYIVYGSEQELNTHTSVFDQFQESEFDKVSNYLERMNIH